MMGIEIPGGVAGASCEFEPGKPEKSLTLQPAQLTIQMGVFRASCLFRLDHSDINFAAPLASFES